MNARDIMTTAVVTAGPGTPMPEIAGLLLAHRISAVPVVDETGAVIGMVSEGDLLRFGAGEREARRDWWLTFLAEGETLSAEFLASLRAPNRTAREIMSAPVVTVGEHADIAEIGKLLVTHRIKRVPVIRDGRIVGIVSRADLVGALATHDLGTAAPARPVGLFALGTHYEKAKADADAKERPPEAAPLEEEGFTATDFRSLVGAAESEKTAEMEAAQTAAAGQHRVRMKEAIDHHVTDDRWRGLLREARHAAQQGETELLILQFPAELCSDGGRAINVPEPDWPATLRGEAAETYLRFEHELKPLGFHLMARVLNFPGGFPGDIGFFLHWGGGG